MSRFVRVLFGLLVSASFVSPAAAREWKDITGLYKLEADLIGFDNGMVILQRANKELGSCPIDKLSEEDREYLQSKEAKEIHSNNLETTQTWTMKSGLKVFGRIVDYDRRDVTVQRRRGKIYVNDKLYDNLPEVYQTMLQRIVAHLESIQVPNEAALDLWVRGLRGQPKTYTLEGVILELENGDEYGVPFFLFSEEDQKLLQTGWQAWQGDHQAAAGPVPPPPAPPEAAPPESKVPANKTAQIPATRIPATRIPATRIPATRGRPRRRPSIRSAVGVPVGGNSWQFVGAPNCPQHQRCQHGPGRFIR